MRLSEKPETTFKRVGNENLGGRSPCEEKGKGGGGWIDVPTLG